MSKAIVWMAFAGVVLAASPSTESSVVGTWRGDSICTVAESACHDEKADYRFAAIPDRPGFLSWTAGKIVDGEVVVMGTMECRFAGNRRTLDCEFSRGVWHFQVDGDRMEGTLTLSDKTLFRKIVVQKQQ